jgi:hypothetical protein
MGCAGRAEVVELGGGAACRCLAARLLAVNDPQWVLIEALTAVAAQVREQAVRQTGQPMLLIIRLVFSRPNAWKNIQSKLISSASASGPAVPIASQPNW